MVGRWLTSLTLMTSSGALLTRLNNSPPPAAAVVVVVVVVVLVVVDDDDRLKRLTWTRHTRHLPLRHPYIHAQTRTKKRQSRATH